MKYILFFFSFSIVSLLTQAQTDKEIMTVAEPGMVLFTNGTFYTSGAENKMFQAMAVTRQGFIIDTGTDVRLKEKYIFEKVIDLNGKYIYPGFIDAHAHFFGLGLSKQIVDLIGSGSPKEAIRRCQEFQSHHQLPYVMGRGWDQNKFPQQAYPNRFQLDSLFPNIPVVLKRIDGHAAWVNTKALTMAGIHAKTKVDGGEVQVENGVCTGILIDNAVDEVMKVIPPMTTAQMVSALMMAQEECLRNGLVYILDAGLEPDTLELMRMMMRNGSLKIELGLLYSNSVKSQKALENKHRKFPKNNNEGYDTAWKYIKGMKFYCDGALGSRGACLLAPYADRNDHTGFLLADPSQLKKAAEKCKEWGTPLHVHAIGDSAVRTTLKTMMPYTQGQELRWRIEHAQVVHPSDLKLFKEGGIIPSVQPTHATSDMYWAEKRLGPDRVKTAYAYQDLLQAAGIIALGTDFPVEEVNPLYTFTSAVFRQDAEHFPNDGFQINNGLSRLQALRGMTDMAAFSVYEEENLGLLVPGYRASFTVLPVDLMKADADAIRKAKVSATYINGQKVYNEER